VKPQVSFFLCSITRSGSTLLADLLSKTNLAGDVREYFNHHGGRVWHGWDYSDYAQYVPQVIRETMSANAVFGSKLMSADLESLERRLKAIPSNENRSFKAILDETFYQPKYIYLFRRDKLRQAISQEKMNQTGIAHRQGAKLWRDPKKQGQASYSYRNITHILAENAHQESLLQEFFAANDILPYSLVYEDFIQRQEETVRDLMAYLQIDLPSDYQFMPSDFNKMGDADTEEWVERYHQDRKNRLLRRLFG
jgi:trehalose 2-sulfotransferase